MKLAEAFVEILARSEGFNRAVDGVQVKLRGLEPMFAKVRMAAGFMFAGISAGAGLGIKAASDLEETTQKFERLFKDQTGAASEWVREQSIAMKRFEGDLKASMAVFQAFFVGLEFGDGKARQMSQQMTQLAVDFASFHNISDDEAMDRFVSAMSGSTTVLQRYGIDLRAATLDQELLRMGLNKTTAQATEAEKTMARMNAIVRALTAQGAVGDAARTADQFANSLKGLAARWKELISQLGSVFLPLATDVVNVLSAKAKAFAEWAKANEKATASIVKVAAAVTGLIAFGPRIVAVIKGVVTAASWLVGTLGGLVTIFGTLAGVVIYAATSNEGYTETLYKMLRAMGLLKGETLDLADALEELGKLGQQLGDARQAQSSAARTAGVEDDIAASEKALKLLEERKKLQQQAFEEAAGSDSFGRSLLDIRRGHLENPNLSPAQRRRAVGIVDRLLDEHLVERGIGAALSRDVAETDKQIAAEKARLAELKRVRQIFDNAGSDMARPGLTDEEREKLADAERTEQERKMAAFEKRLAERLDLMRRDGRSVREIQAAEAAERKQFADEMEKDAFERTRVLREANREFMSESERRRSEFMEDLNARSHALRQANATDQEILAWRLRMIERFNKEEARMMAEGREALLRAIRKAISIADPREALKKAADWAGRTAENFGLTGGPRQPFRSASELMRTDALEVFKKHLATMSFGPELDRQQKSLEEEKRRHEEAMKQRREQNKKLGEVLDFWKKNFREFRNAAFG